MTRRLVGSAAQVAGMLLAVLIFPGWSRADEPPAFVQTQVIAPSDGRGAILGFCVPTDGGLVGVTGSREAYGAGPRPAAADRREPHRLVWFAADGTEARSLDLDFAATAAGAAPDGGVYVAGDGVVALFSAEGREVVRGRTPQGPHTEEERAAFEKGLADRHAAQIEAAEKQVDRLREVVAELDAKVQAAEEAAETGAEEEDAEDAAPAEERREKRREAQMQVSRVRSQARRMKSQLTQLEGQVEKLRRQDPRQLAEQSLRKARQIRGVSATRDAVFIVAAEPTGFGYALWRLDGRLENPEKVLAGLTGCCGQMDVQVFGDRLAIAANRKHCVELASITGEILGKVGHRAGGGDDAAGFGGCCNPMNTCTAPDGSLLTSESNGVVKRFDTDGEFVEIVGTAKVKGGCKNSAIAIEPDGSRLYYMDVGRGHVLVLTRSGEEQADGAEQGS